MVKHILVPVDLSERSVHTIAEAFAIARPAGAHVTVLHVAPHFTEREARQELLARLWSLVDPHDHDLPVYVDVVAGETISEILTLAQGNGVDLIVLGGGRAHPVSRAMFEAVSDAVAREAPCSVLLVGDANAKDAVAAPRMTKLLCGVDLGASSPGTLDVAVSLASACHARLFVRHVVEPWAWPDYVPSTARDIEEARNTLDRSAHNRLAGLLSAYSGRHLDIDAEVLFGIAESELTDAASALAADLIVLGAHSKRVWGRVYLGSTTRYLQAQAPCPILLARPRQTADLPHAESRGAEVLSKI